MGFLLLIVVYVLTYVGSKTFCLSPATLMKLLIMMKYILHISITTKKNTIVFKLQFRYNHTNVIHSFLFAVIIILARIQTLQNRESLRPGLYGCIQIMQRQPNRLASIVSRWCEDSPHNQNIGITVFGAWKQLIVTSSFHAKKKSSVILSKWIWPK